MAPGFGLDALATGVTLVVFRVQTPVSGQDIGRAVKDFDVMVQAGRQLRLLAGIAVQEAVAADDAAFDFVQPQDPPKLGRVGRFALTNDGGLGLE